MTKESKKMTARTLIAFLAAGACLLLAAPSALAAAPAFKLTATSQPTNFVAGSEPVQNSSPAAPMPQYNVIATNIGSAPSSEPVVLTITLPSDLIPTLAPTGPVASDPNRQIGHQYDELPCNVSGQTVTCTDPDPLGPGQWVQMAVPVKVDASASGTLTSQISLEEGGGVKVSTSVAAPISEEVPSFAFLPGPSGFSAAATAPDGTPATQAGSHPSQLTFDLGFPSREIGGGTEGAQLAPAHQPKDIRVTLPRGMVANPSAIPVRCTEAQLNNENFGGCPLESQVGVVYVGTNLGGLIPFESPLYNMVPPPGAAAEFGFNAVNVGIFVHLLGRVNSAGEYELGADAPNALARPVNPVLGAEVQLWNNPSDPSHDAMRGVLCTNGAQCSIAVKRLDAPFLTMPSSCRSSLAALAVADSWEDPATQVSRSAQFEDPAGGAATPTDGCNKLEFAPTISVKPTTDLSDAPTGLGVDLHFPQTTKLDELATANFRDVKVTLPTGLAVNPSGANGLDACSTAEIGFAPSEGKIRFSEAPASCPDAAKLGTVEAITPALDHPLKGAIYAAAPFANPFDSLLAIYLDIEDPQSGVVSKLAGKVSPDPETGQLTAVFTENPELPIEDVRTSFFGGSQAALKTSLTCGTYTTSTQITPWSAPEGADATPSASFATSAAPGGGSCPTTVGAAPHKPAFSAGTINPKAGAYSPFLLKLTRDDGTQPLAGLETTLPKGLLGKLAGISYCSEAQIAAAKMREAVNQGAAEKASPSCPLNSEVGTVNVGAGAGPRPYYAQGRAYLAGPYKGAPLSMVIITPAVAGPYDLGAVVARAALYLNSETGQVRVVSDPLPTILAGIPLDVRSIAVRVDRPDFILNPTNCNPTAVLGAALSVTGQSAPLSSPFQVGQCKALKFAPKLALSLKGGTQRTKHPALKGVVTYPKGAYANIARAQLTLPHSEFLDQAHIGTICTRVQFAADQCPKASVYGFARAFTPLLDKPVEGPVYLRSSSHELPDLVLALRGQVDVDAVARIDTGKGGGIRATFMAVPDAPLSKVVVEMKGGKKGLTVNSENLCKKPQHAIVDFTAQNGKVLNSRPLIANSCGKKKHKKRKPHGR